MRFASLLTNSYTLLILQQLISLWFLADFFLARDSSTVNRLFSQHLLPTSKISPTLEQIEAVNRDLNSTACGQYRRSDPTFDKVVLVVIDALGAEFIPTLGAISKQDGPTYKMPFLEQAIINKEALGFIAKAATPTVTMPRIKALISGTIPSFMDLIYNLASDVSDFHDDNILTLARAREKSIVFYGDDTWLSLFDRTMFMRSRETLSLFASDYTSVDTNVTEMALQETKRDPIDWDYLILHYLGLDHIGHVFGSNESPLIDRKLIEMDEVIREIYSDMSKRTDRTLVIVCGDHGMSQEGNHGGDSKLEVETTMIFLPINSKFGESHMIADKRILQVDLAPTLASLTGLPYPQTSRGLVIEKLLESLWNNEGTKLTCTVLDNMVQLTRLLDEAELNAPEGLGSRVLQLLKQQSTNGELSKMQEKQFYDLAREIQQHLLKTVAAQSDPLIIIAVILVVILLSIRNMYRASIRLLLPLMTGSEKLLCAMSFLLPILMLGSTDYIENEHVWSMVFAALLMSAICLNAFSMHRKHLIKTDLEPFRVFLFAFNFILAAVNRNIWRIFQGGWIMPALVILIMSNHSRKTSELNGKTSAFIFYTIGLGVLVTKMIEETAEKEANHLHEIALLQLISLLGLFTAFAANLFIAFRQAQGTQPTSIVQKLATAWMWFVLLLSRSRNYPFLIANVMMEPSLNSISNSLKLSPIMRALIYQSLSTFAFYAQGNSNLFSSLDVKPGFFGQMSYNLWLAVPLIACATCGSQVYWYLKLFQRVQGPKEQERMAQSSTISKRPGPLITPATSAANSIPAGTSGAIRDFLDMRNFLSLGYFMFVCMILRNHLFIWSVLSPKLVYLFVTNSILRLTTLTISVLPELLIKLFRNKSNNTYRKIIN